MNPIPGESRPYGRASPCFAGHSRSTGGCRARREPTDPRGIAAPDAPRSGSAARPGAPLDEDGGMAQRPDPDGALYLVDGSNNLYRAFYAIRGLSTSKGLPTNAVFGFTSMLRKLLREHAPRRLAVAF